MNIKETWGFALRNEKELKLKCNICGAETNDEKEIEQTVNNICPVCFSFGSLSLEKKSDS